MDNAADHTAIFRPLDAPDIRRQVRFNPLPLLIAQPKQILAHIPIPSNFESGSYSQRAKINEF
jgi:uncharacterized protein